MQRYDFSAIWQNGGLDNSVFPLPVLAQVVEGCVVVEGFDGENPEEDDEENRHEADGDGCPRPHAPQPDEEHSQPQHIKVDGHQRHHHRP